MHSRVKSSAPRRSTGAPRVFSTDEYEIARRAYLERGTIEAVARALACDRRGAARLVDAGEPALHLPSLKDAARIYASTVTAVVGRAEKATRAEESAQLVLTLEARAKAAKQARKHEEEVLGDATKSRADEVRLVRANRISALVLAQVNAELLKLSTGLARSLLADEEALKKLSPEKRLGILRTVAGIVQRTADASRISVNMERLLMGEPTAILGSDGPSINEMTIDEAEQWLGIANRAFQRRGARRAQIETDGVPAQRDEDAIVDVDIAVWASSDE